MHMPVNFKLRTIASKREREREREIAPAVMRFQQRWDTDKERIYYRFHIL